MVVVGFWGGGITSSEMPPIGTHWLESAERHASEVRRHASRRGYAAPRGGGGGGGRLYVRLYYDLGPASHGIH